MFVHETRGCFAYACAWQLSTRRGVLLSFALCTSGQLFAFTLSVLANLSDVARRSNLVTMDKKKTSFMVFVPLSWANNCDPMELVPRLLKWLPQIRKFTVDMEFATECKSTNGCRVLQKTLLSSHKISCHSSLHSQKIISCTLIWVITKKYCLNGLWRNFQKEEWKRVHRYPASLMQLSEGLMVTSSTNW